MRRDPQRVALIMLRATAIIRPLGWGRQGGFLFLPQWLALRFMSGLLSPALSSLALPRSCRPTTRTGGRAASNPILTPLLQFDCRRFPFSSHVLLTLVSLTAQLWLRLTRSLDEAESHCFEECGELLGRPLQPSEARLPGWVPEGTSTPRSG